ncbi:single-stranded DNA-binding protein [Symbiopectobacterium purcellii]|uniref:Single-stranded DNA-binding protein n=1 Tax=Symbiopectobacterium purcellii TaxID=2871826 RepID=A0ABX9AMP9_9ENTR|nr:single-stranded DNA-binding protein [Symbiopectobacterium purcellii]QZN96353.1 single-stranded DNA-binding protein [Symbiopectobacterium purcellii]
MAINLIVASGNIGKDAEQRWTPNGKCIASFSLPVKQGYGEHEKTSWVQCRLLGPRAEKLPQYLTTGTKVMVTGEFALDEWTDPQGNKRTAPVIIVNDIDFGGQSHKQEQKGSPSQGASAPAQQHNQPAIDFTDDIPF